MRFVVTTGLGKELRALLPGAVAGVLLGICSAIIMLDHPVEPLDPPIPVIDPAPLAQIARGDRAVRARIDQQPLPAAIRAVGSAYLDWNAAAASGLNPRDPQREAIAQEIRSALGVARNTLGGERQLEAPLRELRAYHADLFIDELRRRVRSRAMSDELKRLGGGLLAVLTKNGWIDDAGNLKAPESVIRARYKLHWTGIVYGLEDCEHAPAPNCYGLTTLPLEPAELRALLGFLIANPVVREEDAIAAGSPERAIDRRRLLYVERLDILDRYADPSGQTHPYVGDYPVLLARGALLYRLGQYELAVQDLGAYTAGHQNDARARNWHLGAVARLRGD